MVVPRRPRSSRNGARPASSGLSQRRGRGRERPGGRITLTDVVTWNSPRLAAEAVMRELTGTHWG